MMQRFFDGAYNVLRPGGKVCVVYSNYAALVGREPADTTPMDVELEQSDRFELEYCNVVPVPLPAKVRRGHEKPWKADIIAKLTTTVCVLRKRAETPTGGAPTPVMDDTV